MNVHKFRLLLKDKKLSFLKEILMKEEELFRGNLGTDADNRRSEEGYKRKLINKHKEDDYYDRFRIAWIENPDDISIACVDKNLLSQTPYSESYSWEDGGHCDYTAYYAVNGDDVVELTMHNEWDNGSGDHGESPAPTIEEQLASLKIDPKFIVCVDFEDTDDNGNGETSKVVTIYKAKKFRFVKHFNHQIERAAAELKAEVAAIWGKEE